MGKRKYRDNGTFGTGPGVYITHELLSSAAFQTLTHAAKFVLLHFINRYRRETKGDRVRSPGMTFSQREFTGEIGVETFKRAMKMLVAHGFIERHTDLEQTHPGTAYVYQASTAWKEYEPSGKVADKARRMDASRRKHQDRTREALRTFLQRKRDET